MNDEDQIQPCIGVDRLLHLYKVYENKCLCGTMIFKRTVTDKDRETHFSCYECTY